MALAEALLYAERSVAGHARVLTATFPDASAKRLDALATLTLRWTAKRPAPRSRVLALELLRNKAIRTLLRRRRFEQPPLLVSPTMRVWPGLEALPKLATVAEIATWLGLDLGYLRWLADLGDRNRKADAAKLQHYHVQHLPKFQGGFRLLEIPKQHIKHVQRQILHELLNHVPLHRSVHGFRKGHSILSYAEPHARKRCVLRLDLQDFFASISGPRVQALFRTLGYPEHVADLLGGLCTTTTPNSVWQEARNASDPASAQALRLLCRRPHLPQGAPTSPALANLCAFRLDQRLAALAHSVGAEYTRYADDLAFSGDEDFARSASRLLTRVGAIVAEEGLQVRWRKTRLMRSSVRQHLGGLTLNGGPNVDRRDWDQLKATLTNCVRHGPASQNRENHPDFRAHLQGRIAFVAMVKPDRAVKLRALLAQIRWTELQQTDDHT